MKGTGTARKPKRHGHQGNVKKYQVLSRYLESERIEMAKQGIKDVDKWTLAHQGILTQKKAFDVMDRLERLGMESKLKYNQ
jgi:hypothetical protein